MFITITFPAIFPVDHPDQGESYGYAITGNAEYNEGISRR